MDERPELGYIAFRISEKLDKKPQDERMKLMNWLDGHGKPATFLAWLFESCAHDRLIEGVTLKLRNLSTNETNNVAFSETKGNYTRFALLDPLSQDLLEAYRTPDDQNLRSIDSFKKQDNSLLSFNHH